MKRAIASVLVLVLFAVPASRISASGAGGAEQLNRAFLKALQAGDIDGLMSLYAPDAVLFPPGEKRAIGQEEIRFKWNSVLNANRITQADLKDTRYVTSADVSAGWGDVSMRLEPKSGKEPVTIQARFSTIAKKLGGRWVYVFVSIGELDEILTLRHYSKTK